MATENTEVKAAVQHGILDTLMGWNERARLHFREALKHDPECLPAWGGLLITEGATEETRGALDRLLLEEHAATPQEVSLLMTWLRLARGEHSGAGEEFAERAERYRNDILSACWAVALLHDAYDPISEHPLPNQKKALAFAEELYGKHPQHPLVAYLRGWVEESSPNPSDEALSAAQAAAAALPEHPAPLHLYGHLLFRKGRLDEAAAAFHQVARMAEEARKNVPCGTNEQIEQKGDSGLLWPLEIRAKLYESSILWLQAKKRESLILQGELLKNTRLVSEESASSPAGILLLYEARTLPLRLLMLSEKLPSDAQVSAATKAAEIPFPTRKGDALLDYSDCLRYCLVARQRAATGKFVQAARCIQSAEQCLQRLHGERAEGQGAMEQSALTRACEACELALLAAKAATYENSSDIWLDTLEKSHLRTSLLMPPVLPSRNNVLHTIDAILPYEIQCFRLHRPSSAQAA